MLESFRSICQYNCYKYSEFYTNDWNMIYFDTEEYICISTNTNVRTNGIYICLSFNPYMDEIRPFLGIWDDIDMWYDMSVELTERGEEGVMQDHTRKVLNWYFLYMVLRSFVRVMIPTQKVWYLILLYIVNIVCKLE